MTNPVTVELPVMYIAGTETGPSSLNRIPIGGGDVDGRQYMALFKSYDELDRFCNEKGNTSPNLTIVRLNTQEDLRRTLAGFSEEGCGYVSLNATGDSPGDLIPISDVVAATGPANASGG